MMARVFVSWQTNRCSKKIAQHGMRRSRHRSLSRSRPLLVAMSVREAHRESVRVALSELERYTQPRIGNIHAPETTGNFLPLPSSTTPRVR
jgi:hypothetical protein